MTLITFTAIQTNNCRKNIIYLRHKMFKIKMKSIENKILNKIKKAKKGSLFFVDNFLSFGNAKSVSKALERLVQSNDLNN